MIKEEKISVIIPSLNVVKYIRECLESVTEQSYYKLEILCIDAGSTDGTIDILREFESIDERVHVYISSRKSYGYQVNLGLKYATGDYIGIVESDDVIVHNMYEALLEVIKINNLDYAKGRPFLYYSNESGLNQRRKADYVTDDSCECLLCPNETPKLLEEDIFLWNGLYSRELLSDVHLNETPGAAFQDQGFLLQVLKKAKRAIYLSQVVYYYRQDNAASSIYNRKGFRYIEDEYNANKKYLSGLDSAWSEAFYSRMYKQTRGRFYTMVNSGIFWEEEAETAERIISDLKGAVQDGYLSRAVGDIAWKRLHVYFKGAKTAYEWEKREMKKNIEEEQEIQDIIRSLPAGLFCWYPFREGTSVLYIGKNEKIVDILTNDSLKVDVVDRAGIQEISGTYDYIVCAEEPEKVEDPVEFLKKIKGLLSLNGVFLLGMNNRLGIRYFIGDYDIYTNRVFDGVQNYRDVGLTKSGRMFDRHTIISMMEEAGMRGVKSYAVLSDLKNPAMILADGFRPNEQLSNRIFATYNNSDTLFLDEVSLYEDLFDNGMFYNTANAFLFEYAVDGNISDVLQVTTSLDRGRKNAMVTLVRNRYVEKRPVYPEGVDRIKKTAENLAYLEKRGIKVVGNILEDSALKMPRIQAETAQIYMTELLKKDMKAFYKAFDNFIEMIKKSSDIYESEYEDEKTLFLKVGMMDMMPLNCFVEDKEYLCFDQEYCEYDIPVNVIIARVISNFYFGNQSLQQIISKRELYVRYGLIAKDDEEEKARKWLVPGWEFLNYLRKEKQLKEYHSTIRASGVKIIHNRERMNYSDEKFRKRVLGLFDDLHTRKVILFGSGKYAKLFYSLYGDGLNIVFAVDNNEDKWGERLFVEGKDNSDKKKDYIFVRPPIDINNLKHGEYKVVICIKNCKEVEMQLLDMGIEEYGIYDPNLNYSTIRKPITIKGLDVITQEKNEKKYHIGYIAGVFDLYHVGHLNMFKRAKALCDYLIVGVVSDEGVRKWKKTETFVPAEERKTMVESCRYVDEVIEIPMMYASTKYAWKLHHFDVQFSGSDYIDNPYWLGQKEFLEKHGATMEFFPYTESTSSTKLKKMIDDRII